MGRKKTWDVIIAREVMVTMRDGVNLAADLYFPAADGHPFPVEAGTDAAQYCPQI